MAKHENLTGQRFGKLTAVEYVGNSKWRCVCDCGVECVKKTYYLKKGVSKDCGCGNPNYEYQDLTGQCFGKLTATKYIGHSTWRCLCLCGATVDVKAYRLTSGKTVSCGCADKRKGAKRNIAGKRFGHLIAIKYLGHSKWLCRCDCGNECVKRSDALSPGGVDSCGCETQDKRTRGITRHNGYNTRLYRIWGNMKQRCNNPNNGAYGRYGGRGIYVCRQWNGDRSFPAFRDWALANGYRDDLSIDRIDNNGPYAPWNCRWVNASVQISNRNHYERKEIQKPVEALDADGNVIKRFKCVGDASVWAGKKRTASGISMVLAGKQQIAYGYRWRRAE